MTGPVDFSSFVLELATVSGRAILPFFRTALTTVDKSRGGAFDPVTEADKAAEVAMRRLMIATRNTLDALICANDVMAIGAMDAARYALDLRVPEDLSIVGFDGVGPARWASYQLTTVRQPLHRMTESAVAMLLERMERPELTPERRLFAGEVIAGRSARMTPR